MCNNQPDFSPPSNSKGLPVGVVVGIVVGIVALAVIIVILIVFILRWRGCLGKKTSLSKGDPQIK